MGAPRRIVSGYWLLGVGGFGWLLFVNSHDQRRNKRKKNQTISGTQHWDSIFILNSTLGL